MTKKIFGLCGIPRAGNTIFGSLMNQNPKVSVTANSPVADILGGNRFVKTLEQYKMFPDEKSVENVMKNITQNYYSDWKADYIIDRSSWGLPTNLDLFKKYVNHEPKIIVLVRDIVEVLASFVKFSYSNETNYIATHARTLEQRCNYIMMEGGELHGWLQAVFQLTNTENKKYAHMVQYNDLVGNPKEEINKVYEFLDIPKFEHKFTNLTQLNNNGIVYDDTVLGGDLHKIKTTDVSKSDYKVTDILTPEIISKHNKMNFWENDD